VSATLTLLHTNDLHGALTAYGARWLAELKASLAPCLLLDSGDAVRCGNVGWHVGGERAHELMNGAGYDAGALGNREFHFRPGPQAAKLRLARFPVLCANLLEPAGYGGIRARATLSVEGLPPLCVFGLLVPMVTAKMWARCISPARFGDPAEAARGILAGAILAAAAGAVPICLSHLGLKGDQALASACEGLPLILGGHSHTPLAEPIRVGGTVITQNAPHGATVTRVTLEVDGTRATVAEVRALPLKLEAG
jgi:5'-nucleotidase